MQWLVVSELLFMRFNRTEIIHWVCENKRPFLIVKDRGFQSLMKTGRPDYHIPSHQMVSRDVKQVFVNCRQRITRMLQVSASVIQIVMMLIVLTRNGKGP